MNVVHVVWSSTIVLPDEGTDEFKEIYDVWFENEGKYLKEGGEPLPTGPELIKALATFLVVENHVGNYLGYLSGEDVTVSM